jgi:hypothetical protein
MCVCACLFLTDGEQRRLPVVVIGVGNDQGRTLHGTVLEQEE